MDFKYNSIYSENTRDLNPKSKHRLKPATLTKDSNNFHKITENNIINTFGDQPLLLYKKKEQKISHSFDYKMTKKNSDKNIFISDGGLKLKNEKFNSGNNYINTNQNQNRRQIKSLRTYLESINVNKLLKTPAIKNKKQMKTNIINSKKYNPTEEHIFYKTVRGSSNRAGLQKKYFNKEKFSKTEEGFGLKAKIKNNNKLKNLNKYEESKKTEENKNDLIDSLIKGAIKNNFFIIQKKENKIKTNEILNNKKKEYLNRNGIGISDVNLNENDENEKQNEKDEINKMSKTTSNFHRVKLNNYVKLSNGFSPKQKNFYMTLNNETHFLNNNISKNKKQNKPIVDQFEYIKKINEHKRLHTYENISKKERDRIFLKKQKNNTNINQLLNDSFRHKNSNINNKSKNRDKNKIESINKDKKSNSTEKTYLQKKNKKDYPSSLIDVNNDEWPYSHKRSYRSPKELNKFVKEKKLLTKQKLNNEEIQKNTKLFQKFKNLYNLNYQRINNYINKTITYQDKGKNYLNREKEKEKEKEKLNENTFSSGFSSGFSTTYKSANIRKNNSGLRKRKEANEYYIGNDSLINNNSTLIDPNEYYLNVLESQQLLVNSGLNKIENEENEETEELSNSNEENIFKNNNNQESKEEFNTSKEQIQKITKKESKRGKTNNININNIKKNLIFQKKYNTKIDNNEKNNRIKGKEKTIIDPKYILKLVEVLKFIFKKKIFLILYQSYINEAIFQHYYIAFTYFIAICKHKTFRKLEEYSNYKTYSHVFRQLLLPFIRRAFRTFIHNFYYKRKLEFFVLLLNKLFKYKIMQKIFIYSQIIGGQEEELKQFKLIILKIIKTLLKPHLKICFDKIKNNQKEIINPVIIKKEIKENPKNENNRIDNKINNEDLKNEEKYRKINKRYLEYSPTHKNKANSYLYESFNDESSFSLRPNSLDNDKWHQIQIKIQLAKNMIMNKDLEEEDEIDDFIDYNKYKKFNYPQNNSFNSKKSEISSNNSNEKRKEIKGKIDNLKVNKEIIEPKKDKLNDNKEKNKDNKVKYNNLNNNDKQINIIKEEPKNINNIIISNKEENIDNLNNIKNNNNKNKENKNIDLINTQIKIKKDNNQNQIPNDNNNKIDINIKNKKEFKNEGNIKEENEKNKKGNKHKDTNNEEKKKKKIEKKEDIKKEDEKIIYNDNQIKTKSEDKQKNKKKNNENINAPKKEKKKIIKDDDIPEKELKNKTESEIDISAERDPDYNIEWDYHLNNEENKINEESNKEKIDINYNHNLKDVKISNKKKEKEDITIENEKNIQKLKLNLIDNDEDDEKSEESEEKEKKFKNNIKTNNKTLKKDKKALNGSEDDYLDEFEDLINSESSEKDSEKNIDNNKLKKENINRNEEKDKKGENNKDNKNEKSRNINSEKNKDNIQIKENKNEIKINNQPSSSLQLSKEIIIKIKNKEQFTNELTDEILKNMLNTEIKSKKIKLIPHKSFKYDFFSSLNNSQSNLSASAGSTGNNANKELGLLGLNQFSLNDDLSSLNDSIMSSYSAFSYFNRTIKDIKKEKSLNLYYKKIAPKLIKLIKEEIYIKYPRIYENISMPLKNQSVGLMMSLSLQDADMLRDNYKCILMKESIKNIIDKEKILKKFEPINKKIRSKDNLTSDNFYDNILNECLIDTAIELINKERLYGENGDPLAWSSRTHELVFKYKKDDPKKLAKYVCNNLLKTLYARVGLLTENYDYLNAEQINNERDKRLIDNIRNELDDDEYQWRNLEMEETQLKVEIAELIMDQLYNENIEILEHIQYSRNRPDLYQNKSIYSCEEIPKLSFQQTTTENVIKDKEDGDEVVNV